MSKARDSIEDLKTIDANLAAKAPIASPSFTGTVTAESTSADVLKLNRATANGDTNLILQSNGADTAKIHALSVGDLAFHTGASGSLTEKMRINASGIVTKPLQPAFRVCKDNGDTSSAGYIVWNIPKINIGGHYSTSTGKFTAPVAGNYYFAVRALTASATQNNIWIGINHNGNPVLQTYHSHINHSNISGEAIITMAANDYVQIYWGGTGMIHTGATGHHKYTFFQGYLLG